MDQLDGDKKEGTNQFSHMKITVNLSTLTLRGQFTTTSPVSGARLFDKGCMFGNFFLTNGGGPKWIMFFDKQEDPVTGDIPRFRLPVKEGGLLSISGPIIMESGLYVAASSSILNLDPEGVGEDLHIFSQIY